MTGSVGAAELVAVLKDRGIEENSSVISGDGIEFLVVSINKGECGAQLCNIADKRRKISLSLQELLDKYKVKRADGVHGMGYTCSLL